MKAKTTSYEEANRHNLARTDYHDVLGGPTREGCYRISVAGPLDLAALKRIRQHLDLTIELFEEPEPTVGGADGR